MVTDGSADISKRDAAKSLTKSKYQINDWSKEGSSDTEALPEPEKKMKSNLLAESQEWTNAEGTTITAAVQKVEAGKVFFIMNGKTVPYPVTNLSEDTINKLKGLMAK